MKCEERSNQARRPGSFYFSNLGFTEETSSEPKK